MFRLFIIIKKGGNLCTDLCLQQCAAVARCTGAAEGQPQGSHQHKQGTDRLLFHTIHSKVATSNLYYKFLYSCIQFNNYLEIFYIYSNNSNTALNFCRSFIYFYSTYINVLNLFTNLLFF
jgi:hypothetical protein